MARPPETLWLREYMIEYRKQIAREMAEAKNKVPKAIENIPSGDRSEPIVTEEEEKAA
jgi:hypothetical protein